MFFRGGVTTLITQEWGERMCFNAWTANNLTKGDTWGALLPTYNGTDALGRGAADNQRLLWASSVDWVRNLIAIEAMPSRSTLRITMAPATWQEPSVFEIEVPVVPPPDAGGIIRAINPTALGPTAMNPS